MTNDIVSTNQTSMPQSHDEIIKPTIVGDSQKSSLLSLASPTNSLRSMMTSASPLKTARLASNYTIDFDRYKRNAIEKASSQPSVDQDNQQQQSEAFDLYGYGYGYGADEERGTQSPKQPVQQGDGVNKRRKFERRNSKTPAMLLMNSSLLFHLDYLEDKNEYEGAKASPSSSSSNTTPPSSPPRVRLLPRSPGSVTLPNFDSWDGDSGLAIAEDIVLQLQKRKRSGSTTSSP